MSDLKVPFAKDCNGQIIGPDIAEKAQSYFCPSCDDNLILRQGNKKKAHFAHKASESCSSETIIHKIAKQRITEVVSDFIHKGKPSPIIERKCKRCGEVTEQLLPRSITSAVLERKLDSGYIADVAILSREDVAAVIEIKVTHAVPFEKQGKLGIPFIELSGESIVNDPMRWRPLLDKFNAFRCKSCLVALSEFIDATDKISLETKIPVPSYYYRTALCDCWKCKKTILIFTWPGASKGEQPQKELRPKTLQYRTSRMAGSKYWANTCPYCNSLQGDFFIYSEPDSMLFGFECGDSSIESFNSDLQSLALRYGRGY